MSFGWSERPHIRLDHALIDGELIDSRGPSFPAGWSDSKCSDPNVSSGELCERLTFEAWDKLLSPLDCQRRGHERRGIIANADENWDLGEYFFAVARARFILRKLFRLIDEQAKRAGLDPLQHQTLIQVGGAKDPLIISEIATLIDVAPALASRLVDDLYGSGLVRRETSERDKRARLVSITPKGSEMLESIDERVRPEVAHFNLGLSPQDRAAALYIFSFYVGIDLGDADFHELVQLAREIVDR